MNLPQFLKQVDKLTHSYSKKELAEFIHQIARTLPESKRNSFLVQLDKIGTASDGTHEKVTEVQSVQQEINQALHRLLCIEDGDCCIIGNLNEEYDEWYNSEEDDFLFEDPHHVLDFVEQACQLVHRCVDTELYQEAYELYDRIIALEITVEGDYPDYVDDKMTFYELVDQRLLDIANREFSLDALIAAYHVFPMEQRPEAVYRVICKYGCDDLNLEIAMQRGLFDLKDMPKFLEAWATYLGGVSSFEATRLLLEAVSLLDCPERELELARSFYELHPALFEHILHRDGNAESLIYIGQEALKTISPQYTIRSRIALQTAKIAGRADDLDEAERCWLEAFRSDTRVVHYLRLIVESRNPEQYRGDARQIYSAFKASASDSYSYYMLPSDKELDENRIGIRDYYALAFLDGKFQYVLEEGMTPKKALEWSSPFMKEGLSLFLLLLFAGEKLPYGCQHMCHHLVRTLSFDAKTYANGMLYPVEEDSASLLWNCISRWKAQVVIEQDEKILKKLESLIARRVEGILKEKRRDYYGECAAFVAALGEVEESLGVPNGKEFRLQAYRATYPRHRSFHSELKAFGMRESRKKR